MAAWGRLALLQVAQQRESALYAFAEKFGYQLKPEYRFDRDDLEISSLGTVPQVEKDKQPDVTRRPTPPQIPPASFIVVSSKTSFKQNNEVPSELSASPTLKPSHKKGTFIFESPSELMPASCYLPQLQNVLGYLGKTNRIHSTKVVDAYGKAKTLQRVPTYEKQRWPNRLLIVVDTSRNLEPFWKDFERIVLTLKKLLGGSSVKAIAYDEATLNTQQCRYRHWPAGESNAFFSDNPLSKSEAVLVLSDQGVAQRIAGIVAKHNLSVYLTRAKPQSTRVLCLCPALHSELSVGRYLALNPSQFMDSVRMARRPRNTPMGKPAKTEQVEDMLALLSYLPVFDVGLLRKVRTKLGMGGSDLDLLVWNHKCVERNQIGCRVAPQYAEVYQDRYQHLFSGEKGIGKKVWKLTREHHKNSYMGLRWLEVLLQYEAEPPNTAAQLKVLEKAIGYFQSLASASQQQSIPERQSLLDAQCKTVFHSLPLKFTNWRLAGQLAVMAYKNEIGPDKWPEALPQSMRAEVQWAIGSNTVEVTHWEVDQQSLRGDCVLSEQPRLTSHEEINEFSFSVEKNLGLDCYAYTTEISGEAKLVDSKKNCFAGERFTVPKQGFCVLESSLGKLELKSLIRPPWASKMGFRKGQLFSTIRHFPEKDKARWAVNSSKETWAWHFPEPIEKIDQDQYGYYADINLTGFNQRFRWIERGTFMMGSSEEERDIEKGDRDSDETLHRVTLTQGFWLADTALSQAQWQPLMGDNPSHFKGHDKPVENVSWEDAQACIHSLTSQTGVNFRLPTEAEWEYACRAGTSSAYCWGKKISAEHANFFETEARGTVPVKTYTANPWGLYQMHGNVWEWCNDRYEAYSGGAQTDPEGSEEGAMRVLRGGSWYLMGRLLRSASRNRLRPDRRNINVGFRLALGRELRRGGAANAAEQLPSGLEARENSLRKEKKLSKRKE
ncbi:formylglycine-generating enzyme family protein [Teredinibacter turnerae]|uniref:formylglycine-generating enzyme family protein n=1 Tax=Teredinibacter turnerae TaxID=2426 RepID=UPI000B146A18|nr:formylglycine-generating enzyme family protein [Teredinibacter turnerae]